MHFSRPREKCPRIELIRQLVTGTISRSSSLAKGKPGRVPGAKRGRLMHDLRTYDAAVVGGGIAGLTAAILVKRAGKSVVLYERSSQLGGRAASMVNNGFVFNQGPHALYRGGGGMEVLRELGVGFRGQVPKGKGMWISVRGNLYPQPGGIGSLLASRAFTIPAKLEIGAFLAKLEKLDVTRWNEISLSQWLREHLKHEQVRELIAALVRVSTYANAPALQSAGAALRQIQIALRAGVLYLDRGWQTLVNELRRIAIEAGVVVIANQAVHQARPEGAGWTLDAGANYPGRAESVILAVPPEAAVALTAETAGEILADSVKRMIPVEAACLDIGLKRLPRPDRRFALGIDRPFYFSLHSAWAELAPKGGALIHAAKYLDPNEPKDGKNVEREIEGWLESVQPGWRNELVVRRYLPRMRVYHTLAMASAGGLAGRPGLAVPGVNNLFLAGDWVGGEGLLADASLLSAKRAAQLLLRGGSCEHSLVENVGTDR
jgi:phytoene dehydrogenase-like protein